MFPFEGVAANYFPFAEATTPFHTDFIEEMALSFR